MHVLQVGKREKNIWLKRSLKHSQDCRRHFGVKTRDGSLFRNEAGKEVRSQNMEGHVTVNGLISMHEKLRRVTPWLYLQARIPCWWVWLRAETEPYWEPRSKTWKLEMLPRAAEKGSGRWVSSGETKDNGRSWKTMHSSYSPSWECVAAAGQETWEPRYKEAKEENSCLKKKEIWGIPRK